MQHVQMRHAKSFIKEKLRTETGENMVSESTKEAVLHYAVIFRDFQGLILVFVVLCAIVLVCAILVVALQLLQQRIQGQDLCIQGKDNSHRSTNACDIWIGTFSNLCQWLHARNKVARHNGRNASLDLSRKVLPNGQHGGNH